MPDGDPIMHVPVDEITGFIAAALVAVGLTDTDARSVGALMVKTDTLGTTGTACSGCRNTSRASGRAESIPGPPSGSTAAWGRWPCWMGITAWDSW